MKKILMLCLALVMGVGMCAAEKPANKKTVTTVFTTDIDCEHCVKKIMNNVPSLGKGVKDVQVDLPKKEVTVVYDGTKNNDENIVKGFASLKVKADPAVMLELAATLLTIGGPDSMREAQPLAQGAVEGRPGDMKAVEILTVAASANEDWRTAAESLSLLMSTMNPDTPEYVQYEMTLKRLRELAASQKTPLPSTSR